MAWRKYKRNVAPVKIDMDLLNQARHKLLLQMMPLTKLMLEKKKFNDMLVVTDEDGLVYVQSRVQKSNYNPEKLVLLSPYHPYTKLILKSLHEVNHRSVAHTVARSRIWYWIPQASKLVKAIVNKCYQCRLLKAEI